MDIDKRLMAYFRELSPRDRRLMFEELSEEGIVDAELKDFCELLYRERYCDKKDPDRRVDNWLWKLVYMPGLYRKRRFFKKALIKEAEATLSDLHLSDADNLDEMQSMILYLEFRNVAKRYRSTCGGANYASRMLGLKKASDDEKKKRACEDIWISSKGIATVFKEEKRMKLWCNALYDELIHYDESLKSYYEQLDAEHGGNK